MWQMIKLMAWAKYWLLLVTHRIDIIIWRFNFVSFLLKSFPNFIVHMYEGALRLAWIVIIGRLHHSLDVTHIQRSVSSK